MGRDDGKPDEARVASKAEAVRRALAAGVDKPQDGVRFIKERFGLVVSPKRFSAYKAAEALR